MINSIGSSSSYYNSLFATNGTSGTGSTNSSSSLSQTEEQLFASIDTNGDGSLSQTEFDNFLQQATGSTNTTQANALFSQLSGGGSSVSLQQFESNAGTLASALEGSSTSGSSPASSLLSQLQQSAQSLVSASAASITGSQNSSSTSNTNGSNSAGHHGHHGHGGNSLISQFVQQYQAAGGTTAAASTLTATA